MWPLRFSYVTAQRAKLRARTALHRVVTWESSANGITNCPLSESVNAFRFLLLLFPNNCQAN